LKICNAYVASNAFSLQRSAGTLVVVRFIELRVLKFFRARPIESDGIDDFTLTQERIEID
jgi:hypothetical protein